MGYEHQHHSWRCTILTQASLLFVLYFAFYIGRPHTYNNKIITSQRFPIDLHFISVTGGLRPLKQQTHLLKQMEKVARIYKVKFVVNISELGEGDALLQNGTLKFPSLKIPWYTTRASQREEMGMGYFLKQIPIPHNKILDIIAVDTGSFRDYLHMEQQGDTASDQFHWLMKTLAVTDSNWHIVVGFHPLMNCQEQGYPMEKVYKPLRRILLKYGVNAYISKQGCAGHYTRDEGLVYIGNPTHEVENHTAPSVNGSSIFIKEMHDGFVLHRVSPLEITSYFINSESKIVFKSTIHQRGKEVM